MPPHAHSMSAGRPAAPDTAPFPVLHGLLELAKGIAIHCFCNSSSASAWEPVEYHGGGEYCPRSDPRAGDLGWPWHPRSGQPHPGFSFAIRTTNRSVSSSTLGRPQDLRNFDPSNLLAMSFRYQASSVSGFATAANSSKAFRLSRWAISANVAFSASDNSNLPLIWALRMRFSAARYSFLSSSSWSTVPVM